MTSHREKAGRLFSAIVAASLFAACAGESVGPLPTTPPQQGHAFLKIVGDENVFLDSGASREIVVKYVNDNDEGLAGSVSFRIEGDGKGSALSAASGVTGPGGEVRVHVTAGAQEAAFRVVAEAQYATAVDWSVAARRGTPTTPVPLNLAGAYRVESTFDLVSGLPGDVGQVVTQVIAMTDGPTDPTTWLLDLDKGVRDTLNGIPGARPALDAFLNTLLKEITAFDVNGTRVSIVGKFQEFGNAFGDVAKKFGLKSKLEITKKADGSYVAKHTIDGVFFKINNRRVDATLAQLDMDNIVVDHIPVTLSGESRIAIGDHSLPLSYGTLVVLGLDNVVIPLLSPGAGNVAELLADLVDCAMIGEEIYEFLSILNADFFESLCSTAISAGGQILEGKLREIGGRASEFKIHGDVRLADTNSDRTVDTLVGGEWEGRLLLGNESATLARPNQKFTGSRMAP
jgi:hypothetical protein